jgi:GT2 family glycosyltransferase/ubiquinone/menaquinone biosynthesis C-methylase UbiE
MNKIKLKTLIPDLYLRHLYALKIIKKIQKNKPCNILDIGGKESILGHFIKKEKLPYNLTVIDIRPNNVNQPTTCNQYIQANFLEHKFSTKQFDIAISLDVLEHIQDKQKFIEKIFKVSKKSIISAPFNSQKVKQAERILNNFFFKYSGKNHPWLKEHLKNKLPEQKWLEKTIFKQNYFFKKIGLNNIENWLIFMLSNFLFSSLNINTDKIKDLNHYYNSHYNKLGDSETPNYRNFYIISKNKTISSIKINSRKTNYSKQLIFKTKIIDLLGQEIEENLGIKSLLNTTQRELYTIKLSKFYKLWRFYNHIKENPKNIIEETKTLIKTGVGGLNKNFVNQQYQLWLKQTQFTPEKLKRQKKEQKRFLHRPKFTITTFINQANQQQITNFIDSIVNQSYNNWELFLINQSSKKTPIQKILNKYPKQNKKINVQTTLNSTIKSSKGTFISFLNIDDQLTPQALFEITKALNKNFQGELFYSDEDVINPNNCRVDPQFKPDWSPDTFLSTNYLGQLLVLKKTLFVKFANLKTNTQNPFNYDLLLKITENTNNIVHIPQILCSRRKRQEKDKNSINFLSNSIKRRKIKAKVEKGIVDGTYRIKYSIVKKPLVSIIIPTKEKVDYLKKCLQSILYKTSYSNYEILIIDNQSQQQETLKYYQQIKNNPQIKIIEWNHKFNFSSINNFAVKKARGEYIILLNNDTEVISPDWIESMLEHAQRREIGAVGVKLLYPNNTIQHAGVILGIIGIASHSSLNLPEKDKQVFPLANSKDIIRNFSAVTAACLMIAKNKYLQVNGLDKNFRIAFNDVDFCLKLVKKGYFNVYTPYASLYHHEQTSVGNPQKGTRDVKEFNKETKMMIEKWNSFLQNDPFYNKNLSLTREKFNFGNTT